MRRYSPDISYGYCDVAVMEEDPDGEYVCLDDMHKIDEIDWKLKLMQVLDAVGQAEGIWSDPWDGVSGDEFKIINREFDKYKKTLQI